MLKWEPLELTAEEVAFMEYQHWLAHEIARIFKIPYECLGMMPVKESKEKLYTLPVAARKMGISERSLYRYIEKDVQQPENKKYFPNIRKFEYETCTHTYFSSSDIRSFNRKFGKPEDRKTRIVVKFEKGKK